MLARYALAVGLLCSCASSQVVAVRTDHQGTVIDPPGHQTVRPPPTKVACGSDKESLIVDWGKTHGVRPEKRSLSTVLRHHLRDGRVCRIHLERITGVKRLGRAIAAPSVVAFSSSTLRLRSLDFISRFGNLRELDVSAEPIESLGALSNLPHLEYLDISFTPVREISSLGGLVSLRAVNLSSTRINGLEPLEQLPRLEMITICGSDVEAHEMQRFRAARPDVTIVTQCD